MLLVNLREKSQSLFIFEHNLANRATLISLQNKQRISSLIYESVEVFALPYAAYKLIVVVRELVFGKEEEWHEYNHIEN